MGTPSFIRLVKAEGALRLPSADGDDLAALDDIQLTEAAETDAVAAAAPMGRPEALATLRRDAGGTAMWAATSSGIALRVFLASRREADLRAGRLRR